MPPGHHQHVVHGTWKHSQHSKSPPLFGWLNKHRNEWLAGRWALACWLMYACLLRRFCELLHACWLAAGHWLLALSAGLLLCSADVILLLLRLRSDIPKWHLRARSTSRGGERGREKSLHQSSPKKPIGSHCASLKNLLAFLPHLPTTERCMSLIYSEITWPLAATPVTGL